MRKVQKQMDINVEEYKERLYRVRRKMGQSGVSLLLADTPENITYLTGFQTPGYYMYSCALVPLEKEICLIIRMGEMANALSTAWIESLITYEDIQDPIKLVSDEAKRLAGNGRTAVEMNSNFMTVNRYQRLVKYMGNKEIVDGSAIVAEARIIKSSNEIEIIREAARIVSVAMKQTVDFIEPGKNENEIAAAIFQTLMQEGSEYLGLEPFVNSGKRTGAMHASWQGRLIRDNEPVLIEIGGCCNRYHAALMRTVFIGSVPKELTNWAEICNEALNAAIGKIRPGVTSGQVDEACRAVIEKAGLYERFRKRTGYSIGLAYAPDWGEGHILSLQKDDSTELKPGMTFHMPPALREYNRYGCGLSETVLVTETGCEVLTEYPERLIFK